MHRSLRRPLRRTNFASVLTVPALAAPFEVVVPGEIWTQIASGVAEAVCPCKASVKLTVAIPAICSCGRPFLYTGREVRATWRRARDIADVRAMLRQIRFDS